MKFYKHKGRKNHLLGVIIVNISFKESGGGGIRTQGTLADTLVFKTILNPVIAID